MLTAWALMLFLAMWVRSTSAGPLSFRIGELQSYRHNLGTVKKRIFLSVLIKKKNQWMKEIQFLICKVYKIIIDYYNCAIFSNLLGSKWIIGTKPYRISFNQQRLIGCNVIQRENWENSQNTSKSGVCFCPWEAPIVVISIWQSHGKGP